MHIQIDVLNLIRATEPVLKDILGAKQALQFDSVGGGSINHAYRVKAGGKSVFVKLNQPKAYPGMFAAEERGLNLLRARSRFHIPEVLKTAETPDAAFIIMELIETGIPKEDFWEGFACNLAHMHQQGNSVFGLDHENYIGSLPQANHTRAGWADFYVEMRLEPQLKQARNMGLADVALCKSFDRLFAQMDNHFPEEAPALLHGDLWSGNFMCTSAGTATIFDPAVYYGHREMDLAMSKLFGGFDRRFYEFYHESYPLENGWQERIPLGQLYPLLVHVNLFGGGYVQQLKSCLHRFV
ncbi:MAG: hypothetical protein EA392_12570 [Cryomorphaceae bacterium]|nr:MAG: hypothetical protein EA392_12570 [Cryomorphaceae bacterium]